MKAVGKSTLPRVVTVGSGRSEVVTNGVWHGVNATTQQNLICYFLITQLVSIWKKI